MTGALALLLVILGSSCARADVGVVLNESLNTSVARITGSGHSAIYLSRICPATPVKLRMCGPDEQGSIISNYTTLGEDEPFEWNIVPLNVYLCGFLNPQEKPLFASEKIKALLEERYREDSLIRYCAGPPCTTSKKAEWREMVAETSSRSIYIFAVKTTVQQDRDLIARFNAMPNENHFNAFIRNCANFTEGVINTYFPNAAKPDYINDFGLTSPKAIARSFAHYAERHPASEYQVLHFAQLPGTIKRSTVARDGTEQLYRSKKLLIPMVLVASHELPVFAASYILTGRFDPEHEFEQHSSERATAIDYQIRVAASRNDAAREDDLKAAKNEEQAEVVGSPQEWARYREEFDAIVDDAVRDEVIPDRSYLHRIFKYLDGKGQPYINSNGLWMEIREPGRTSQVGLSPSTIALPGSDAEIAYQILLAHVAEVLKSPAHSRETMPEFKEAWSLLESQHARMPATLASQQTQPPKLPEAK